MVQVSAFDVAAPGFDRHRALPDGVPEAIRSAILAVAASSRPRLLDLGAGTGRVGRAFVAAGDDYVGIDLSLAMLHEFAQRGAARLVQADGAHLPFRDATFDGVMLIQVFGGMREWRRVLAEARRVLRPAGALVIGRTVAPADGLDARMRQRLTMILGEMGVAREGGNRREEAVRFLEQSASASCIRAAAWEADRTPRGFLERHRTGAGFAALPAPIRDAALGKLAGWASAAFGSLDRVLREPHYFELRVFKFQTNRGS
jgi:ubiquinone/menaquinone biosynthesis C-methylase UbiE